MKRGDKNPGKELYKTLRGLSWKELWDGEARRFDAATPGEREKRVGVIRAVAVVFRESGDAAKREEVRKWLGGLLADPSEKVRRYAMAALPKLGADAAEEARLLEVLESTSLEREKKFAARALEKIGGAATLENIKSGGGTAVFSEQKIKASLARSQSPSAIRFRATVEDFNGMLIHLRGRRGLEGMVAEEAGEYVAKHRKFSVLGVEQGLVSLGAVEPFSLADLYSLRCFGSVGLIPGGATVSNRADSIEGLAAIIASQRFRRILDALTEGAIRYRLNFVAKGHQRSAVRLLADRVYALAPEILNDARNVTWTVDIYPGARGGVELRPNVTPDPRFLYRKRDVPASSHPQLAAALARLAGKAVNEVVWDPFCGSGQELIERAFRGGVQAVHGTDISGEAIEIARGNFAAASPGGVKAEFVVSDFRQYAGNVLKPGVVSLVLTNPPLGMRVPVKDLHALMAGLFDAARKVLCPGGRLVFANPLSPKNPPRGFQLVARVPVDFGGFDCRMEKYLKV
jgi:23S rRNA G2445 N2-methylase RlmL